MTPTTPILPRPQYGRVLLITASHGLDVVPEVDSLYALGYEVRALPGRVTRARLFRTVLNETFDIIHFAGHSGSSGLQLDDGILEDSALAQLAKLVRAQVVFINGCNSLEVGQFLVDEGVPYAICTLEGMEDTIAKETAQAFYTELARSGNVSESYFRSKPTIKGGYSLFQGPAAAPLLENVVSKLLKMGEWMRSHDELHEQLPKQLAEFCSTKEELSGFRRVMTVVLLLISSVVTILAVLIGFHM